MSLIFALMGLIVLLLGQRLFWLALGALAWVWGMNFLGHPLEDLGEGVVLLIAVVLAVVAGVIGRSRNPTSVAIAGFLSGSLMVSLLAELVGVDLGTAFWPVVAIAGVLGILVSLRVRPMALILLFSLCGALIIPISFELQRQGGPTGWLLFIVLAVVGFLVQTRVLRTPASTGNIGAA